MFVNTRACATAARNAESPVHGALHHIRDHYGSRLERSRTHESSAAGGTCMLQATEGSTLLHYLDQPTEVCVCDAGVLSLS